MTIDRFEEAWRRESSGHGLAVADELTSIVRSIERNGRFEKFVQINCAAITVVTTVAMAVIFSRRGVNWSEVAPAVALQILAAVTLIVLIRRRMERRRRFRLLSESVSDAVRTALSDTTERIGELKVIAGIGAIVAAVLAFSVHGLYLSGKMDAKSVAGFAAVTATVLLANTIGWGLHFRRTLRPRRQRLEAFVAALGE